MAKHFLKWLCFSPSASVLILGANQYDTYVSSHFVETRSGTNAVHILMTLKKTFALLIDIGFTISIILLKLDNSTTAVVVLVVT